MEVFRGRKCETVEWRGRKGLLWQRVEGGMRLDVTLR